jgi:hypothetical protein
MGQEASIFTLTSLTKTVSARVPEHLPSLRVAERKQQNAAVTLKRAVEVP